MVQLGALFCALTHSPILQSALSAQFGMRAGLHHPLHSDSHLLALSGSSVFLHSPSLALHVKPEIFLMWADSFAQRRRLTLSCSSQTQNNT